MTTFLSNKEKAFCKVTLTSNEDFKTKKQLAYYYAVIIPTAANGYRSLGYVVDNEKTDYLLRMEFYNETIHDAQGGAVKYPLPLSLATKTEMSRFMENCIIHCAVEFNMVVEPPPLED